jgi:hypothetical protein
MGATMKSLLLCFAMRLMLAAKRAELLEFETFGCRLFVLRVAVVSTFTFVALQLDNFARHLLTPQSPLRFPLPRSFRLRGLRTAALCP